MRVAGDPATRCTFSLDGWPSRRYTAWRVERDPPCSALSMRARRTDRQPATASAPARRRHAAGGARQTLRDALRHAEERLELVLRGTDLGLWDWNVESGELTASVRMAEMIGYAPDEIEPTVHAWARLIHPDDRDRVFQVITAHLHGESAHYRSEHRMRSKTGEWVWVLVDGSVVRRGADGRPLRVTGTQFDITEQKRSEAERAMLLELARELAGTLGLEELVTSVARRTTAALPADAVATIYWDPDAEAYCLLSQHGLGSDAERAAQRIRFPLGEMFGGGLARGETILVEDVGRCTAREQRVLERFGLQALIGAPLTIRGQVRGAFLAARMARRAFALHDLRFLDAIARQLTAAIEASALHRAQQAEHAYSAAMASVGQELISSLATPWLYGDLCRATTAALDCDFSAAFLWSAAENAFAVKGVEGETAERAEALAVVRLTPPMTAALFSACAPTGLARLGDLAPDDPVRCALAGHGIAQALLVTLRRGSAVIGFHCAGRRGEERFGRNQERIARGIAQLASLALESARLVEELERANRVKSDFVATMSHELRTPLNVVIGYHDLLLDGEFGALTAEQADRLRRADASARELLDLINATLDLSRLEARQMPIQVQDVDVPSLLQQLDADIGALRQKPGVTFSWRIAAPLPTLRTDPVKLKVVLKNLIHNAIKFTDAGTVTVSVASGPGRLELEVADTGIGIPGELHAAIFEPFRQADSSSTRSYGGVGLGLYIVRRLLELLGGAITVDSAPGQGARFRFWLPLVP